MLLDDLWQEGSMRPATLALFVSALLTGCNHPADVSGDVGGGAASADTKLSSKELVAQFKKVANGGYDAFVLKFTQDSPADTSALTKSSAVDLFRTQFDIDDAVPHFEADSAKFRPVIFVAMTACKGMVRQVGTLNKKTGQYQAIISGDVGALSTGHAGGASGAIDCPDLGSDFNQEFKMYVTSLDNLMAQSAVTAAPYTLNIDNDE
jgi:hypothetical protein